MNKCSDCGKPYEATQKSRYKCNGNLCQAWTHKQCSDKRQFSLEGYWYCKLHIVDIPLENRRSSVQDEEESENNGSESDDKKNNESDNEKINISDTEKSIPGEQSNDHYSSLNQSKVEQLNPRITQRKRDKNLNVVPFDNGDAYNPFSNFHCSECNKKFTKELRGALCTICRSTYHLNCLNETELEDVKNYKFVCQHCIQNQIRIDNLSGIKDNCNLKKKNDKKYFASSTPKIVHAKSNKKSSKHINSSDSDSSIDHSISLSSCDSSSSSNSENERKLMKKYKKLKKQLKKQKSIPKIKVSKNVSSNSESSEDESHELSQNDAMLAIYKLTLEERDKSKYEKLPIVDNVDTKWSVFFDLFKQSRKMFSDSENVLRIQKSIKSKEILEIGGISLLDPRTYWQSIKLINERLAKSFNLLQRETNEIIKLNKLRNDTESKKIIEFINKIINYSHVVDRYGKKKHKVDDRVISHIGNIMPYSLMNGWHKSKSRLEDDDKTISIKHLANYLSKQVSHINSKMQAEETDPWKENHNTKFFKRIDFGYKRTYNTNDKVMSTSEFSNYCWLHKSKGHSSFSCSKLWELSGKEVSDIARKNNICTFCGLKKHKDCHVGKTLNCKIENCNLKHHILFCYKRPGKNNNNANQYSKRNENNNNSYSKSNNKYNRNSRRHYRSTQSNMSHQEDDKNVIPHPIDDKNNNNHINDSESEDIIIPPNNLYINQPPKSIKVKRNAVSDRNSYISTFNDYNNSHTIRSEFFHNHASFNKITRSSSCILGVLVVNFVESNEVIALLIDSGSTVSIIEENIANRLELKGIWSPLRLNWSSDMKRVDYGSRIVKVKVSSTSQNSKAYDMYFRTVKGLNIIDQPFDAVEMIELFPHLNPMHLTSYCKVYGIIGIDNLWCFNQLKTFKPNNWHSNIPFGIRCPLGDYVVGCINQLEDLYNYLSDNSNNHNIICTNESMFNIKFSEDEEQELAYMDRLVLGMEYNLIDSNDNNSYEDSLAIDLLNKYVKRSENNINFEAPLLWKTFDITLPTESSFKIAFKRFLIVEKNSIKNGRFNECIEQVDNLLQKNYAEIVPPNELKAQQGKVFYLPTFFIQPKNKRTRFIWDAATKVEGKSLNDYLLSGPNMYNSYLKIILQMREGRYLVKGDLQEMFHQVVMRKEDRDSLRFLFRKSPNDKVQILRMRVMIFGSKSSPTTSQFVKNKVAEPFIDSHPDASDVIINKTYVDDVITSVDNLQIGKSLINDVRHILKTGGFNLVKLKSNCNEILETVRKNLSSDDLKNEKLFSKDDIEKLLGYNVNFNTDEFSIALTLEKIHESILNCTDKPTKKQVLQLCMSIFDPIGFVEFLVSKFKLIYHWIIKDQYDWNQIMSDDYFIIWKKCMNWLKELVNIKIPRWYSHKLSESSIIQLVGFGDAGTEMLCAVIYLRLLDINRNQIDYNFICAKSYTVPHKQSRTIPDLEVDIACKLAILMNKIEKSHNIIFHEKIFFTDNSAVKEWIENGAKNPKVYVHNRLEKIKKLSKPEEWKWIPTHLQPADYGTKISSMPEISYSNNWFNPSLFQLPENNWPSIDANINNSSIYSIINTSVDDITEDRCFISKYSCLDRLIDLYSRCMEWKARAKIIKTNKKIMIINSEKSITRSKTNKKKKSIEALKENKRAIFRSIDKMRTDYRKHELALIKMSQKESFKNEYKDLLNGKEVSKKSQIYKVLPYLDNFGVMRSQTRISNTEENRKKFGHDRINSIILHRESHLTKLIILKEHNLQVHLNEKTVVTNLLQRFYVNKIRRTVNNVIRKNCLECRIAHAKPVAL